MAIVLKLKPIFFGTPPKPTGMARAFDSVNGEHFVVSTNGRISQCYQRFSELSGMDALSHPVLVAYDLVGHPGKAHDGELLRLDPHKQTCQVFLSCFQDVYVEPTGEIGLLRGAWEYFDVWGNSVPRPANANPPSSVAAAPLAATPPVAAPLCPPSAPAIVVPRTDPVVPAALANKCDASGAPCYPSFVQIPAGTIDRAVDPQDEHWTTASANISGHPSYRHSAHFFTQTTITNAMYREYLDKTGQQDLRQLPPGFDAPRLPATHLTYQEAEAYASWLYDQLAVHGVNVRDVDIPDRMYWEYVARTGQSMVDHYLAVAKTLLPGQVYYRWAWSPAPQGPIEADSPAVAPIDFAGSVLHQMTGNVWEWVMDTQSVAGLRTVCGGSWRTSNVLHMNCGYADFRDEQQRWSDVGFRVYALLT